MNRHCSTAAEAGAAPIRRPSKMDRRIFKAPVSWQFCVSVPYLPCRPLAAIAKIFRPGHDGRHSIREPNLSSKTIEEPARQIPLYGEYEVSVLGGGPAGIAAAVASARAGRRTLLIERYGFLGGMGTAAGATNFCGLHAHVHCEMHRVAQGIPSHLPPLIHPPRGLNPPRTLP